jgi:hypothetical protein
MKNIVRRPRSPLLRTLQFTEPELCRIERAATSCGKKASESALWARGILLTIVDGLLRGRKSRRPGRSSATRAAWQNHAKQQRKRL